MENSIDVPWRKPRVLVVDDDENGLASRLAQRLCRDIEDVDAEWTTSFDDAEKRLREEVFDLVVLDLMLGQGDNPENEAGKALYDRVSKARWLPVVFFTGRPDLLPDVANPPSVQVVAKPLIEKVVDAVKVGLASPTAVVTNQLVGLVEGFTRSFLRDVVAPSWRDMETADQAETVLVMVNRLAAWLKENAVAALHDKLGDQPGLSVDHVSAASVYLYPPVTSHLNTADLIIDCKQQWWLVLTPACDLYESPPGAARPRKASAEYVRVAPADGVAGHPVFADVEPAEWSGSFGSALQKENRYRYLPHFLDIPHLLVDMERATSVPLVEVVKWRRVATLDSPFAEAAVNRFSGSAGRIGHPDIDLGAVKAMVRTAVRAGEWPTDHSAESITGP